MFHSMISQFISKGLIYTLVILASANSLASSDTSDEVPLETREIRHMKFPKIVINEGTENGSYCVAKDIKNPPKSLCPNKKGRTAFIEVSGNTDTLVTVHPASNEVTQNGIAFKLVSPSSNLNLGKSGKDKVEIAGQLKLVNKDSVQEGTLSFNYDVSVVYQ